MMHSYRVLIFINKNGLYKRLFLGLKFEEITRKLRDSERKIRELERKGSHQAEYEAKVAEMQAEIDEKIRQNRRLTENLDKTTERFEIAEEELKRMKARLQDLVHCQMSIKLVFQRYLDLLCNLKRAQSKSPNPERAKRPGGVTS